MGVVSRALAAGLAITALSGCADPRTGRVLRGVVTDAGGSHTSRDAWVGDAPRGAPDVDRDTASPAPGGVVVLSLRAFVNADYSLWDVRVIEAERETAVRRLQLAHDDYLGELTSRFACDPAAGGGELVLELVGAYRSDDPPVSGAVGSEPPTDSIDFVDPGPLDRRFNCERGVENEASYVITII